MKEFELKYGCNPNQKPAKIYMRDGSDLPIRILCGLMRTSTSPREISLFTRHRRLKRPEVIGSEFDVLRYGRKPIASCRSQSNAADWTGTEKKISRSERPV